MSNLQEINKLLQKCINSSGRIDIIKLANLLNIEVVGVEVSSSDEDFNASIEYRPEHKKHKYQIKVNILHSLSKQRFSIAHEISHFILHKDILNTRMSLLKDDSNLTNSRQELEADQLAISLLMPEDLVDKYLDTFKINKKESEINKDIIRDFSKLFRVSPILARARFKELGYKVPYISYKYSI